MTANTDAALSTLIDWIRPTEADGPLVGAVLSTYSLSLSQPDFFGQDFLPTLLGLGGVRDRGYASPVRLDRALATADVSMICDAHALSEGARPTLRVDVVPIGHKVHHAKVILIHRQNRIRLIVTSANLTHEGFRRQREVAMVMDFHEDARLPPTILTQALSRWEEVLGEAADAQVRRIFAKAEHHARQWSASTSPKDGPDLQVVFGGGAVPLWKQLVDAWPKGEPVLNWHICSPFWPQVDGSIARNPFETIAQALIDKGSSLDGCNLEILTRADAPNAHALPRFPFPLISHLRSSGFPIKQGRILPVRLDATAEEVPEGMAAENRDLHAKWIMLAGPQTRIAYVGSANFTRRGLGVLRDPLEANIEAGVLMRWTGGSWHPDKWRPPIQGQTVDWASCSAANLQQPPTEEEKTPYWPTFIQSIELAIWWEHLPEPDGELRVHQRAGDATLFRVAFPSPSGPYLSQEFLAHGAPNPCRLTVSPEQGRSILSRRVVEIQWAAGERRCLFPVNILHESKAGMPSILGAKPSEDQLLAYFHGHISEEDLLASMEQRAREDTERVQTTDPNDVERLRRLQSYVVREFVESLYGLTQTVQVSSYSPRAAEQALLGDLSPVCLAEQIVQAFMAGKRSPAAAGFQLAELIRVVGEIAWHQAACASDGRHTFENVRRRAIDRLFTLVEQAATRADFIDVVRDRDFSTFVQTVLPSDLASRWEGLASRGTPEKQVAQGAMP